MRALAGRTLASRTLAGSHIRLGNAASIVPAVFCLAAALALPHGASAGSKKSEPPKAAAAPQARPAPQPHISGNRSGPATEAGGGSQPHGAHLPGNLAGSGGGGAHLPSSLAGSSGGAHLPANLAGSNGGAHLPNSVAPERAHLAGTPATPHAGRPVASVAAPGHPASDAAHGPQAVNHTAIQPQPDHGPRTASLTAGDGHAAPRNRPIIPADPLRDQRLGSMSDHAARNLAAGYATPRAPRSYLRAPERRDLVAERDFVARRSLDFHHRYVRDMDGRERALWRAGLWHNEWHYGRRGWWWEADGAWYPYDVPVFPYPDSVALPVVYDAPIIAGPDLSAAEAVPGYPVAGTSPGAGSVVADAGDVPPLPAAPSGWYQCGQPDGYYPSQASCGNAWDLVQTPPLPGE